LATAYEKFSYAVANHYKFGGGGLNARVEAKYTVSKKRPTFDLL